MPSSRANRFLFAHADIFLAQKKNRRKLVRLSLSNPDAVAKALRIFSAK